MTERPAWFTGCIIGAVFATILLPNSAHMGFFSFLLHLLCIAMFIAPMVYAVRDGELS